MSKKKCIVSILFCLVLSSQLKAQEFQATVSIIANRVPNSVDHKIFQTLQTSLNTFINNRKWSNASFQFNEKIVCIFILNISQALDNNQFLASLTVQAARPVYNSSYSSPL